MKVAAFYARVSTPGQEKEQTIASQIAEIEEKAKQDGNIIGQNFRFIDDGWTSEMLARPALDLLRDAAKNKTFEVLYLYDLGRLSRIFLNELILKNEIKESGIEIISLHDINGDTPESKLGQDVMGLFHDYERIKIAERFRRGKMYKAKSGKIVGYNAPYGYRYICKTADKEGYFIIYEPEAEIIRMIFKWVDQNGYTIRKIIKKLYELGIKPPKGKSDTWKKSTIKRILTRTDYIGISYYNKTVSVEPKKPRNNKKYKRVKKSSRIMKAKEDWIDVKVPSIIKKDLFERVQERLKLNLKYNKRNKKYPYLLSGKVFCDCGSRRVGDGVNGHHYYRCAGRIYKYPLPHKCQYEGVNAEILDTVAWNKFLDLLSNRKLIEKQTKKWLLKQSQIPKQTLQLDRLKETKNKLSEEEKRYIKAYGNNLMSFEQFEELIRDLKAKGSLIDKEINQLSDLPKENAVILDKIPAVPYTFINTLKRSTFSEKQEYVRKLITGIYVGERRTALMKGQIPLQVQAQNIQYETINRNYWSAERRKKHVV